MTLFAPLVSGALSNTSANNWGSKAARTDGESKTPWGLVQAQGLKLLLFLMNFVLAFVILCISHWIYSTFCDSRLRTIDKTRKLGFVYMILYQSVYFHIRDDPNSQRGVLLGYFFPAALLDIAYTGHSIFLASAGFTYKSSSRGAARFDFGLFYAVAGITLGIFILWAVTAWMMLNSGGPTWDTLLFPCIALAFLVLEIGANCFRANMMFRDEDESQDDKERLPYYHEDLLHQNGSRQSVNHALEPNELAEPPANPWA